MDLKSLIKKRGSYKARLTQFSSYLNVNQSCESLSSLQINELNIRLSKIEELYSDFDCTQIEIENLSEIPDDQYKERETFETQYFGVIAAARDMLTRSAPASAETDSGSVAGSASKGWPKLKLPSISIPSYSGQYLNWLEFHDTYSTLIHSDNSIPKINKFHYLRAALKDSAALIISSLDFSAENYDVAWQLLCERYNNKRLLINNHIHAIFAIESIQRESAKALRNIIDTVNKNLRALKTLKLPTDHWDILIIHIVSSKLDIITTREWETYRNNLKDIPSLLDFNTFLKNRADLLETMDESQNRRHSDTTHTRHKSFIANSHSPPTRTYTCPLCKHNHAIYQCPKFKSLPVEIRIQKAKSLKLCINCLRQGHNETKCKLGHCKLCLNSHNTLLHVNHSSLTPQSSTIPTSTSSSVVLTNSHQNNTKQKTKPIDDTSSKSLTTHSDIVLSSVDNTQNVVLLSTVTFYSVMSMVLLMSIGDGYHFP
ncbi:uncharacterized protein LOC128202118 [Galleria mellonella]|uniref:Uncharacterized protein LOC128202118 n=1 Tax=Galleria mellonella TaxID=7137 RepID=A0ABM3N0T9_GALME|nr:uncharacterized protein LOC128202118 [Galleria mellonella]